MLFLLLIGGITFQYLVNFLGRLNKYVYPNVTILGHIFSKGMRNLYN